MKTNRFCFIITLKEEFINDYINIHKNAWEEIITAQKKVGVEESFIWIYKNLAIVYYECKDINKMYLNLEKFEVTRKWNELMKQYILKSQTINFNGKINTLEKIFDLNEQYSKLKNK